MIPHLTLNLHPKPISIPKHLPHLPKNSGKSFAKQISTNSSKAGTQKPPKTLPSYPQSSKTNKLGYLIKANNIAPPKHPSLNKQIINKK